MKIKVNFTIDNHLLEKLDKLAKDWGVSRSAIIAFLINEFLKDMNGEK